MPLSMNRLSLSLDTLSSLSMIYETIAPLLTAPQLSESKTWGSVQALASVLCRGRQHDRLAAKETVLLSLSLVTQLHCSALPWELVMPSAGCDKKWPLEAGKTKWTTASREPPLESFPAVRGPVTACPAEAGACSERLGSFAWDWIKQETGT